MAQKIIQIPEPALSKFMFADTRMAFFWLVIRIYVGFEWLLAGWGKFNSDSWTGKQSGLALKGFLMAALKKTAGEHPDVQGWYAWFLQNFIIPHSAGFAHVVTYGEILVGVGLILGCLTGIAAFFGAFMNMNYLFAGTVSINPLLFILGLFLILAWRVAGFIGIDYWLLPYLGTPWQLGKIKPK